MMAVRKEDVDVRDDEEHNGGGFGDDVMGDDDCRQEPTWKRAFCSPDEVARVANDGHY